MLFAVRIVLKVNPPAMHSILERMAAEEEEESDGHYQEEEEGGAHSLKDVCDLRRPAPSPFSSRRVMFENEQVQWKCEQAAEVHPRSGSHGFHALSFKKHFEYCFC